VLNRRGSRSFGGRHFFLHVVGLHLDIFVEEAVLVQEVHGDAAGVALELGFQTQLAVGFVGVADR